MRDSFNKEELKQSILTKFQKLQIELETIPVNAATEKQLQIYAGKAFVNINNIIAYLIGWGELVLKWNRMKSNWDSVNFPETGFKWRNVEQLAQKFFDDFSSHDINELCEKLELTVENVIELIEGKSHEELFELRWYKTKTLGQMITLHTAILYENEKRRICKWKKMRDFT